MKNLPVAVVLLSLTVWAQSPADSKQTSELQNIVSTEFGSEFVLLPEFPVLTGDFNGDGSEDVVFAATSKTGLQVVSERFQVFDPSNDYFGIGDPKITSQFASPLPGGPRYLLIIHGAGKEGWHAKEPKARFVLINVVFDRLSIGHVVKKKKIFDDINVDESGILTAFLYWNGHRYKWQPGATS